MIAESIGVQNKDIGQPGIDNAAATRTHSPPPSSVWDQAMEMHT